MLLEKRLLKKVAGGLVLAALSFGCATVKIPTKVVNLASGKIESTGENCYSACREKGYDYGDSGKEFYTGNGLYEQKCSCRNHHVSGSSDDTGTNKDSSGKDDSGWIGDPLGMFNPDDQRFNPDNQNRNRGGHYVCPK